jgi:hypothetical protein
MTTKEIVNFIVHIMRNHDISWYEIRKSLITSGIHPQLAEALSAMADKIR